MTNETEPDPQQPPQVTVHTNFADVTVIGSHEDGLEDVVEAAETTLENAMDAIREAKRLSDEDQDNNEAINGFS